MPNGHKFYQMDVNIPNGHKIYKHFPLQDPQKSTQIGIFWFEKKPSGNPGKKAEFLGGNP
jgi:hypothetical protein